jgi:hypothetical protein
MEVNVKANQIGLIYILLSSIINKYNINLNSVKEDVSNIINRNSNRDCYFLNKDGLIRNPGRWEFRNFEDYKNDVLKNDFNFIKDVMYIIYCLFKIQPDLIVFFKKKNTKKLHSLIMELKFESRIGLYKFGFNQIDIVSYLSNFLHNINFYDNDNDDNNGDRNSLFCIVSKVKLSTEKKNATNTNFNNDFEFKSIIWKEILNRVIHQSNNSFENIKEIYEDQKKQILSMLKKEKNLDAT